MKAIKQIGEAGQQFEDCVCLNCFFHFCSDSFPLIVVGGLLTETEALVSLYFPTSGVSKSGNVVPEERLREVKRFEESIATIKEMFLRDNMKVVFFGR